MILPLLQRWASKCIWISCTVPSGLQPGRYVAVWLGPRSRRGLTFSDPLLDPPALGQLSGPLPCVPSWPVCFCCPVCGPSLLNPVLPPSSDPTAKGRAQHPSGPGLHFTASLLPQSHPRHSPMACPSRQSGGCWPASRLPGSKPGPSWARELICHTPLAPPPPSCILPVSSL